MSANDDRDRYGDLEPIAQIINEMVRRGVVHRIDDTSARQRLQIECLKDDAESAVEYVQPYGFKSVPREPSTAGSAECVCLLVAGDPDHPLVVAVTDVRDRPTGWAPGDVGLYDHRGNFIRCQTNKIEIDGAPDIQLGAGAVKGVARRTDAVQGDVAMGIWMGQVQAFINGLAPGTVAPPLANMDGTITGGSASVTAKD